MSLLAPLQSGSSVAVETLGGSSGTRADIEPLADDPTSGGRLFLSVDCRLTTSHEAVTPTVGRSPTPQQAMILLSTTSVSDQIDLGTSSGSSHTIFDNRNVYPSFPPQSGTPRVD